MDTRLAVHAGAEVLVVGGVFLYLNKQLSAMKEQNETLAKEVEQLKRILQAHDEMLGTLFEKRQNSTHVSEPAPHSHMQLRRRHVRKTPPPEKEYKDEELDGELARELDSMEGDETDDPPKEE